MLHRRLVTLALVSPGLVLTGLTAVPATAATNASLGAASKAIPICGGKRATIVGTDRADRLIGTEGPDVIVAKGGPDVVRGRGGNDLICGGPGRDQLHGGSGDDIIHSGETSATMGSYDGSAWGGEGDDILYADKSSDPLRIYWAPGKRLFGGPGKDTLYGSAGTDYLDGGAQDDRVEGRGEADKLNGGPGQDTVIAGEAGIRKYGPGATGCAVAPPVLRGGRGDDVLQGRPLDRLAHSCLPPIWRDLGATVDYSDALRGVRVDLVAGTATGQGADTLSGIQTVIGSRYADRLVGADGDNRLVGGAGDDEIVDRGVTGIDQLEGGTGDDTFDTILSSDLPMTDYGWPETIKGTEGFDRIVGLTRAQTVAPGHRVGCSGIDENVTPELCE